MKIKIEKILDRTTEKERLWLKVLSDTDLQYYIVFDTTYISQSTISNLQRHAYWFDPKKVSSGDYVVLYTKKGKNSEKENSNGTTTYFVYWDLDHPIWNNEGDCAILFEVGTWETSKFE